MKDILTLLTIYEPLNPTIVWAERQVREANYLKV